MSVFSGLCHARSSLVYPGVSMNSMVYSSSFMNAVALEIWYWPLLYVFLYENFCLAYVPYERLYEARLAALLGPHDHDPDLLLINQRGACS